MPAYQCLWQDPNTFVPHLWLLIASSHPLDSSWWGWGWRAALSASWEIKPPFYYLQTLSPYFFNRLQWAEKAKILVGNNLGGLSGSWWRAGGPTGPLGYGNTRDSFHREALGSHQPASQLSCETLGLWWRKGEKLPFQLLRLRALFFSLSCQPELSIPETLDIGGSEMGRLVYGDTH